MLVLAIDTATPAVTAGLLRVPASGAPRQLGRRVTVDARAHAELLMPSVQALLSECGVRMRQLAAIVCGAGPGPFTGLRVGMVTAAALGDALSIPAYPVCSLDAIAHEAPRQPLLVLTDARRKEVYWARYAADGRRVDGPHVQRAADVPTGGACVAAGAAAGEVALPAVEPRYPSPVGLVAVARAELLGGARPAAMTPLYLRRPDAAEPGARKRVLPA